MDYDPANVAAILDGAVSPPMLGGQSDSTTEEPTDIRLSFSPNYGMTLKQAASICDVDSFDWQQTILHLPAPVPPNPDGVAPAPPSENDGPPGTQTYYPPSQLSTLCAVESPTDCEQPVESNDIISGDPTTATTLNFFDAPADPCLFGGAGIPIPCGFGAAKIQSYLEFETELVGIKNGQVVHFPNDLAVFWADTFNGNAPLQPGGGSGGIVLQLTSYWDVIPDSGSGGITMLTMPLVLLPPSEVATTASGLAYSRVSQTFNGTVTITNISSSPISGPFQIFLAGLTAGATLANATGNFSGSAYLTVPAVASLAAGQAVTVGVQFADPSFGAIKFNPMIYSGSF
jgi:hypothetical protein